MSVEEHNLGWKLDNLSPDAVSASLLRQMTWK